MAALVALGMLSSGCEDLPHENGVEWDCFVSAERGGLTVGGHPSDGRLWTCVDPDIEPFSVQEQCEAQCESKWCTWGAISEFPYLSFCTDATCTWSSPSPASPSTIECNTSLDPGGPASANLDVTGSAVVTVDGNSGSANGATGILRYFIGDCGENECPIHFVEVELTVPTFDIDGHDITAYIHNNVNAEGTWSADTKTFSFPAGALFLAANFTVDGDGGAVSFSNATEVTGTVDPDNDAFSLNAATFIQDEVTVEITSLTGVHTNRQPTAVIQPESPIECNQPFEADIVLDASASTDPDDNIERFEWRVDEVEVGSDEMLPFVLPFGNSEVELSVFDDLVAFDDLVQTIEVVDTTDPTLLAPPDIVAECESSEGTAVDLGEPFASDVCDPAIVVTNDELALYPLGETIVTWSTEDFSGNGAQAEQVVDIVDTTPPTLTLSVSPTQLWPPNHKLVTITSTITVEDVCDAAPVVQLVSITSNEPDNGLGDGDTANDIQNAAFGTDDRTFSLRAERQGGGSGRVYTITYQAMDGSGNTTTQQATVTVPMSR
jgi:hypothetical protein